MKYILIYDNSKDWEDYYQYKLLIDGDSVDSVRKKVVDAFEEAVGREHFIMIIDGYIYPMPDLDEEDEVHYFDFEVLTVENYLRKHLPSKA
jgi:hypothetical protein